MKTTTSCTQTDEGSKQNLIAAGIRGAEGALSHDLRYLAQEIGEVAAAKTLAQQPLPKNMGRYCYVTARHEAFKRNTLGDKVKKAAEKCAPPCAVEPAPLMDEVDDHNALVALLEKVVPAAYETLSDTQKEVIRLIYWDNHAPKQIASELNHPPFNTKLNEAAVRKCHQRALNKLRRNIVNILKLDSTAIHLLTDTLQDAHQSIVLVQSIRKILFANELSIRLMADKLVASSLPAPQSVQTGDSGDKTTPTEDGNISSKGVFKWKVIAHRKEELVGEILTGLIEYPVALETCKAELGGNVACDFIALLRQRIREVLTPSNPTNGLHERLESIYRQSLDDLHEFQDW